MLRTDGKQQFCCACLMHAPGQDHVRARRLSRQAQTRKPRISRCLCRLSQEDYRLDYGVAEACEPDVVTYCAAEKGLAHGNAEVLKCLVKVGTFLSNQQKIAVYLRQCKLHIYKED